MPNWIERIEFSAATSMKQPVIYNFGPEGRDACISAVEVALENFVKWHNERILSRPVKVTCDSSQCGSRTVDVDEESRSELQSSNGGIITKASNASPDASSASIFPADGESAATPVIDDSANPATNDDSVTPANVGCNDDDPAVTPPPLQRKSEVPPPLRQRFTVRRFRSLSTPRRPLEILSPTDVQAPPFTPKHHRASKHGDRPLATLFVTEPADRTVDAETPIAAVDDDDHLECIAPAVPPSTGRDADDVYYRKTNEGVAAVAEDALVAKPMSKYEMKIKQIHENILHYSKTFLGAVLFFAIFRVFVY